MLKGFTAPYSATGRSAIVPAPPWHYAGWILSIEFEVDSGRAINFLPEPLRRPSGLAAVHFADWQATSDGSELIDPTYSQYREFFLLIEAELEGEVVNFCPFIFVDQDISLVRGWLQGLPKKLGSVWLTRSYPLDHPAAAPARHGTRLGASVAVKDRRLADATLELTGKPGRPLGFLRRPTLGLLGLPRLLNGASDPHPELVHLASQTTEVGELHEAQAHLSLMPSPRDELFDLSPRRIVDASAGYLALTINEVTDATSNQSRPERFPL